MILRELLVCVALQAGSAQGPPVAVEAVPLEESGTRFFSGQQIRLALRFYGGRGLELDLRARPFQLAHAMAAPVGPWSEVAAGVELGEQAWRDFSLILDCPVIERITSWELRHECRVVGEESWQSVGTTRIELYPPDLLQPLRKLATTQPWFVSDSRGTLRAFLTEHGIPFRNLDSPAGRQAFERPRAGAEPELLLWVREPVDATRPAVPQKRMPALEKVARVLVFAEPSSAFPYTTLRLEPQRTRVTVNINLLSSLTDDPRAQMQLVEAFRMTQIDLGEGSDE